MDFVIWGDDKQWITGMKMPKECRKGGKNKRGENKNKKNKNKIWVYKSCTKKQNHNGIV